MAIEGFKLMADGLEVKQPVDAAQKMIRGNMILNAEPVKQRFLNLLPTHHRLISSPPEPIESVA